MQLFSSGFFIIPFCTRQRHHLQSLLNNKLYYRLILFFLPVFWLVLMKGLFISFYRWFNPSQSCERHFYFCYWFYFLWYLGRRDNKMRRSLFYNCKRFTLSVICLFYFLWQQVFSIQLNNLSFVDISFACVRAK